MSGTLTHDLSLYLVMDIASWEQRTAVQIAEAALAGGVTMLQLREKKAPLRQVLETGKAIRRACREHGVPFIVNDRVDLAILLEADGVHVGQDDLPALDVRRLLGPDAIIGVSAGSMEEAEWAVSQQADYLGVGAIYATLTKGDAGAPIGTGLISRLKARWPQLPLVGIGGIQPGNAAAVIQAGADGIAVVSAISRQSDPGSAAFGLADLVKKSKA
ncbi:thiamine-phosphate pyrophosphorylase [Paenibacillus sp. UNCCL117]|uniref:thiamine phosphate synthase n=1 Tax=unclassified Paenibacillus TaxID=185978 RepID=UPI00088D132A|nr:MULTISPECIES: thiamine phosphate synthase [unclassified Paenibacillus]SDC79389.1 thiamine-phosphate diphosphorylase [Paenibacillus sp. cl123]SFW26288.1 thiamine-phosphate pyrophosphorylase [Paenibacillus sp. UNCCL117]